MVQNASEKVFTLSVERRGEGQYHCVVAMEGVRMTAGELLKAIASGICSCEALAVECCMKAGAGSAQQVVYDLADEIQRLHERGPEYHHVRHAGEDKPDGG